MYAQLGFRELDLERVLRTLVSTSAREDLLLSCWPRQRVNHERPGKRCRDDPLGATVYQYPGLVDGDRMIGTRSAGDSYVVAKEGPKGPSQRDPVTPAAAIVPRCQYQRSRSAARTLRLPAR